MRFYNSKLLISFLFLSLLFLFEGGCKDSIKTKTRKACLDNFSPTGHMINGWDAGKRKEVIELRKAVYSLNNDWDYYDEGLKVIEVSDYDFLIRYTCTFKNLKNNEFKIIEETYYCDGNTLVDPIILKREFIKVDIDDKKKSEIEKEELLWEGDFDKYCIKPGKD